DPQHERRFPAAADRQVADDDHRNPGAVRLGETYRIGEAANARYCAERNARGPQQAAECGAPVPVLREKIRGYLVAWVVKVICDSPAPREASMMRITDWCVALASALMITTGSFRFVPARRISCASCS